LVRGGGAKKKKKSKKNLGEGRGRPAFKVIRARISNKNQKRNPKLEKKGGRGSKIPTLYSQTISKTRGRYWGESRNIQGWEYSCRFSRPGELRGGEDWTSQQPRGGEKGEKKDGKKLKERGKKPG